MSAIIIIGGGAGGLMSAIMGARAGAPVLLLERNDRLGKKLLITGKGRCNVTSDSEVEEIVRHFPGNGAFLYSALRNFDSYRTMQFFEDIGVPLKVERGQRVFPVSDRAQDVVDALEKELRKLGGNIRMGQRVRSIKVDEKGHVAGVITEKGDFFPASAVIIATGGMTYPGTGSTGDGYELAKSLGHTITRLRPSLVPLITAEEWVKELQGLSLKNVRLTLSTSQGKKLGEDFGEMLFTHFGLSGPLILSLSKKATDYWEVKENKGQVKEALTIKINLKPALTPEQLDRRIQRDFERYARKQFKNALQDLLPKSLIPVIIKLSTIDEDKFVHQISRQERLGLVELIQGMKMTVIDHRSMKEAIVTAGGVTIKEIHPKTMASKLVKGLFLVGEVVDVDGYTGGYNLQGAWSMGVVAGKAAAEVATKSG
ncbi:NAD(P)/FAD-dependent oxidoreductase [Heliorestis acidaminivorans]|uniref:NAD(P)/FAD-dependent oxidoreductase n=1 Tax=Heliorestis acidaminivorans TaxID=553427 RepID=A0A6I0ETY3_9FIRM|nr:NAD(P)/FAD-dependent oxidoreductase [Heliorestis acidaminivorans]KAB2952630.1 NAD(P)/FAD-dependent oxidoreductase [Heliorestis acidaminivorans]